ncbi:MAG: J domain-containing protein [Alphaproteobacteria bacterium]|nr:J domain-containing protein [Alphaproteobacteria bacterium]
MSNFDALGYYAILGVDYAEDISVIKKQYYQKAKYWHPDHNTSPNAQDMFQMTSVAYGILQNPRTRLIYDLLSCIYTAKDFPLIGSLKIYKNQKDNDDKALRVLKQRICVGKSLQERKDICNISEAGNMVLTTSVNNWLKGWWHKNGFNRTLSVIRYNMQTVSADDRDNLKLLIHNAVAYEQENNKEMAWIYAKQAESMQITDEHTLLYIGKFIEMLDFHPDKKVVLPYWNSAELKRKQMIFPLIIFLCVLLSTLYVMERNGIFVRGTATENEYYEVRQIGGYLVPSDMVESHIIKTGSNPYEQDDIWHIADDCVVYYGPDARYSPLRHAYKMQTVRIVGYTVDKKWYQIIMDDGAIGYVRQNDLEKGFGTSVPAGSHVFKG